MKIEDFLLFIVFCKQGKDKTVVSIYWSDARFFLKPSLALVTNYEVKLRT
jgi:hypothetical protein